ncbi:MULTISPECIES: SMR family transporter [Paracoccus]|uniref:QacE family quaternary ammonium compound efflux SMR transporter n=1 Tax=Paracoccus aerius TaxID=1915382 RepID=A0ABS1S8D7_9RHOB|nr:MULTISPECIES: SMR family transporter [Paracoccus]MBL3674364.1 QacE family quaternary ammonium compound efflux SMR transporter [Paracoccus aerius]QIR85237.1 QacE family quaternary ammonium compound efflux SMR transporter [Paracoccus sp. AK26]GHG25083.1 QacE family quaternary ammonium compound efflux SMR transporter [Paracoccus aerius]
MTYSPYVPLVAAIGLEVVGTSLLQRSEQFTRLAPTVGMALCYLASFYLLSLSLRALPLGIAYAIWSALGIVLVALIGFFVFGQRLDLPAVIGLALIVLGVLVVNLFSRTVGH